MDVQCSIGSIPVYKKNCFSIRNYGFTTIELVVTITILGILSYYSFNVFGTYHKKQQLKSIAREITSDLSNCKTRSIGYRYNTKMDFTPGSYVTQYKIYYDTSNNGSFETDELVKTKNISNYPGIQLKSDQNPTFTPGGLMDNAYGVTITIKYTGHDDSIKVVCNFTGTISIN